MEPAPAALGGHKILGRRKNRALPRFSVLYRTRIALHRASSCAGLLQIASGRCDAASGLRSLRLLGEMACGRTHLLLPPRRRASAMLWTSARVRAW